MGNAKTRRREDAAKVFVEPSQLLVEVSRCGEEGARVNQCDAWRNLGDLCVLAVFVRAWVEADWKREDAKAQRRRKGVF